MSSGTMLNDTVITLVRKLSEVKEKQSEQQDKITRLEERLQACREASLELTNHEHELAIELQSHGFVYGQLPVQSSQSQPVQNPGPMGHDQLAAMLSQLFMNQNSQQISPVSTPAPSMSVPMSVPTTSLPASVPTSVPMSFPTSGSKSNAQNWPMPQNNLGPIALPSPTSGSMPRLTPRSMDKTPTISPTSAPSISIRKGR